MGRVRKNVFGTKWLEKRGCVVQKKWRERNSEKMALKWMLLLFVVSAC